MAERAQVGSIDAIAAFRAALIIYLTKARTVLEEVSDEKQRTRVWLESDRRVFWEGEYRRRMARWQEAQQELFNARLSQLRTATAAQTLAVERAALSVREAEKKRDAVKRWTREFESRVEPLAREADQLQSFLGTDLVKAVVYLGQILDTLQSYTLTPAAGAAPTISMAGESTEPSVVPLDHSEQDSL